VGKKLTSKNIFLIFLPSLVISNFCCDDFEKKSKKISTPSSVNSEELKSRLVIFPRISAVKIEKRINITKCEDETKKKCVVGNIIMLGSGVVVKNCGEDALILSADHVCDRMFGIPVATNLKINKISFHVTDLEGEVYNQFQPIEEAPDIDACILKVMKFKQPQVYLASSPPTPGMAVYNISAPNGFFSKDIVFITDGYYLGVYKGIAAYSLYSYGGSSGSMIINRDGRLVGMIHSVSREVDHFTFSPLFSELKDFILRSAQRYCLNPEKTIKIRKDRSLQ
jgi:hypothetical protein